MMTKFFRPVLIAIVFIMNSCSSDGSDKTPTSSNPPQVMSYTYDSSELETLTLINNYRTSIGLNELKIINHMSYESEVHDDYMIANKVVNHNDFVARSENIKEVLGAVSVGENIAFDFNSAQAVLSAWLNSPTHKQNIEGNYTHFGISIRVDADGKKYYTNIFAKI